MAASIIRHALIYFILTFMGRSGVIAAGASRDVFPECGEWAERGDCKPSGRPYFMQENCPVSCHAKTHREPVQRMISDDDQEEFFELSAKDASGKVLSMENFEGYVTVLVNAARVCDYSEIFYGTLEHLHSINPYALEILAFPFDHSDIDTTSCREAIKAEEKKVAGKIHVMDTIKMNGPDAHPVYKYLKKLFDIEEMDPNFSHYVFINPDCNYAELHYGASWKTLKTFVDYHVKHELGDTNPYAQQQNPNMMDPKMMGEF